MAHPLTIAITGGAGQIGYQLAFRVAGGGMLGPDQPISLRLLEIPQALDAAKGVEMELHDCAFPLLHDIKATDNAEEAFDGVDIAILVGAKPRGKGMERGDLLQANASIFSVQGKALNGNAANGVKVLVVGNPANTNALITAANAPDIDPRRITAMSRLDHNRALTQLAQQTGTHVTDIRKLAVWGNHSATQYPDITHCEINGKIATSLVDEEWIRHAFIPTVQQRGAAIIKARGASSAASAASAAIDHVRDWVQGSPKDDFVSMSVPSDGSYGIEPGIMYSFPVVCRDGNYEIVQNLEIDAFSRERMDATEEELRSERRAVEELL